MYHSFDTTIADMVGVNAAVIFQSIAFWCEHCEANDKNYHDDHYWTYCSVKAFGELFTYLTTKQINVAIDKLVEADLIIKGNYNKSAYDRTTWYAVTDKGNSIYQKRKIENKKRENQNAQNGKPIPITIDNSIKDTVENRDDIDTLPSNDDVTPGNVTRNVTAKRKRFTPPTVRDLWEYAKEKGYTHFNAEAFEAYYSSKGWMVGKSPMKDWKAAVRGWVARDREEHPQDERPILTMAEYQDFLRRKYGEDYYELSADQRETFDEVARILGRRT